VTARTLARAGLIVTVAFLVSRVLGWLRIVVITGSFGATPDLDAFFAAFRIPDLMFQLVAAGALSSALIPVVAGLLATDEERRAWRVVSTVANLMLVVLLVLATVFAIFAEPIVELITPGFDQPTTARTLELTRIMVLSPALLAMGAVATSALNAQGRFAAAAVAPIVYNLAIIGAAIFLAPILGITSLAVGVVAASLGHALVQVPTLRRRGFRYEQVIDLSDPEARQALRLLAPRAVGLGAGQIAITILTSLATGLGTGAVSAFVVATTLLQLPLGVIGVPLGVVMLPTLSREIARGDAETYVRLITRALRLLVYVMVPVTVLGILVREQIVDLLLGYGRFGEDAVLLTADTLVYLLPGLTAHALIAVLARSFYAAQDTATPVKVALVAVVVNVVVGVVASAPFGLRGLGFAIAVGAWIEAGLLLAILGRRQPLFDPGGLWRALATSSLAAAVAGLVGLVGLAFLVDALGTESKVAIAVEIALVAGLGGLAYLAMSLVLRIPELPALVAVVSDLVRRPRGP
jgi:putative peptidoglycan lipid II flippase